MNTLELTQQLQDNLNSCVVKALNAAYTQGWDKTKEGEIQLNAVWRKEYEIYKKEYAAKLEAEKTQAYVRGYEDACYKNTVENNATQEETILNLQRNVANLVQELEMRTQEYRQDVKELNNTINSYRDRMHFIISTIDSIKRNPIE